MEKKLTAQGPKDRKSYTVTLPIDWIKEEKLDKTKRVDLNIVGDKIIISPNKELKERVFITSKDYNKSIIKVLQGLYRSGVNEIKFEIDDNAVLEKTLDIIEQRLIGYEIVEQKSSHLIIKDITKESEEEFKTIFRRIFLLCLELSEAKDEIQIKTLDRNIKKLSNYCQRILVKKGHNEFTKTPLYYLIIDRLEKISDEYTWLIPIKKKSKERQSVEKEINKLLRKGYELFYKFDPKDFDHYQRQTYLLKNKVKLGNKVEKTTIHHHNLARIINSLYGDIFILKFDGKGR